MWATLAQQMAGLGYAMHSSQGTPLPTLQLTPPADVTQSLPVAAMLLAAGRGERMRPLTDTTPKPLLLVQGKPLMQWLLEALVRSGCKRVVINTAWLGKNIVATLGNSFTFPPNGTPCTTENPVNAPRAEIQYSHEAADFGAALETAGGIARALPLLCDAAATDAYADVFWVLAGDVYAPQFEFTQQHADAFVAGDKLAHLWLVPNPAHHPKGDFGLDLSAATEAELGSGIGLAQHLPDDSLQPRYTYSTIGLYRKAFFSAPWCDIPCGNPAGLQAPLAPLLRAAMRQGRVSAQLYTGAWTDVGTPERLALLNAATPHNGVSTRLSNATL